MTRPRTAAFGILVLLASTASAAAISPTYTVYPTREGLVGHTTANGHLIEPEDRFAALPSGKALTCDGCYEKTVRVCNPRNGHCAEEVPIWDVGPWNTRDDYWNPSDVREMWTDLSRGTPEAQAAYFDDYNLKECEDISTGETRTDGADQFDRCVLNPSGIDLADGVFHDLGISCICPVNVTYNWVDVPGPEADPTPAGVELTSPSDGATVAGPWVDIRVDASDPESGVEKVTVYEDVHPVCTDRTPPYGCSWSTAFEESGEHWIHAAATNGVDVTSTDTVRVTLAK